MVNNLNYEIMVFDKFIKTKKGQKLISNQIITTKKIAQTFPKTRVQNFKLDDYVLGNNNKNSFCYNLEYVTGSTSSIKGATSNKFGIYFSPKNHDYKVSNKYPQNKNSAFDIIKNEICDLIDMSTSGKLTPKQKQRFYDINLQTMVKSKILSVYNVEKCLAVNSKEHLILFLSWFGKSYNKNVQFLDLQQYLIKEKDKNSTMKNWSLVEFSVFLYRTKHKYQGLIEEELDEENQRESELYINNNSQFVDDPHKKPDEIIHKGLSSYRRDPKVLRKAIENANGKCELNPNHTLFTSKNGKPYLEGHHLIPMQYCGNCYDKYHTNIDITQNIVALCCNCHSEIHHGKNCNALVKDLFNKRQSDLANIGLKISQQELLDMYN